VEVVLSIGIAEARSAARAGDGCQAWVAGAVMPKNGCFDFAILLQTLLNAPSPYYMMLCGHGTKSAGWDVRELPVATYRMLWLNHNRNIIRSKHIECHADETAISLAAREILDPEAVEICR
jgi:hypothetical protein